MRRLTTGEESGAGSRDNEPAGTKLGSNLSRGSNRLICGKTVNEAAQRVGEQVQPTLDQGKAVVQDLANRASETGRQAVNPAGEFIEGVAPQAKQVASNLYEQGSQSGEYVRQTVAQQPVTALLIAGAIGYALGYLMHRH